jgi:hypothetical protein
LRLDEALGQIGLPGKNQISKLRQSHTSTPNAADSHAPAARNGLMILYPNRSHAKAENAKAKSVTPVPASNHVELEVGTKADRSRIASAF